LIPSQSSLAQDTNVVDANSQIDTIGRVIESIIAGVAALAAVYGMLLYTLFVDKDILIT
jgi:hypothetical protein